MRKIGFLAGVCQTLDIGATMAPFRKDNSENIADSQSLRSDWEKVGTSMTTAMHRVKVTATKTTSCQ